MGQKSIAGDLKSCLKKCRVDTHTLTKFVVAGTFIFSKEFCAYEGHFPGKPILPAIVQLAAARFLAEKTLCVALVPVQMSRVKFKGMVLPGDEIEIQLSATKDNCFWNGSFKLLKSSGEILSSGQIRFTSNENE